MDHHISFVQNRNILISSYNLRQIEMEFRDINASLYDEEKFDRLMDDL